MSDEMPAINDRPPNFRTKDGRLYLRRCFACEPRYGRENYILSVLSGTCAWCGWSDARTAPAAALTPERSE